MSIYYFRIKTIFAPNEAAIVRARNWYSTETHGKQTQHTAYAIVKVKFSRLEKERKKNEEEEEEIIAFFVWLK